MNKRTIDLHIEFKNGDQHSWGQKITGTAHRNIAWIHFIKWYHGSTTTPFTIRCKDGSTTIDKSHIRLFRIKEVKHEPMRASDEVFKAIEAIKFKAHRDYNVTKVRDVITGNINNWKIK